MNKKLYSYLSHLFFKSCIYYSSPLNLSLMAVNYLQ